MNLILFGKSCTGRMPAGIADEVAIGATILTTVLSALFVNKIPRTRGRLPLVSGPLSTVGGLIIHVGYVFLAIIILKAIPTVSPGLDKALFSEFGVVIVGTALPLMESIRAVLTVRTDDDTAWLSYWLAFGCFQFSTEHLDTIADSGGFPFLKEHWHEIEFFVLLWCWFPLTDGASLTYDVITRPLLMPLLAPLKAQVDGLVAAAINFGVNCGYSYALWWILAFSMYPTSMQRFFVIVLGTAYPIFASLFAVATDDKEDDTFWLTYWISYNVCSMFSRERAHTPTPHQTRTEFQHFENANI